MSEFEVRPTITVLGLGGAGCNTLNRLYEVGINVRTIAVHTEANHLRNVHADEKILIGKPICKGLGSGGNPAIGERAVKDDLDRLLNVIGRPNVLLVTGGLGGGTASGGMAPLLDAVADRFPDVIRIALVTIPFSWEGVARINNARYGLTRILEVADLTLVNLNDMLGKRIGSIPAQYAFKYADSLLTATILDLIRIFTLPHTVSISFADFSTVVRNAGLGCVGLGVGLRVNEAARTALNNVLLDAEIKEANAALVYLQCPPETSLEDTSGAAKLLTEEYGLERVYWGLTLQEGLERNRVMILASGVRSPTIEGLLGRAL